MIVFRDPPVAADLEFAATSDYAPTPWVWMTSLDPPTLDGDPVNLTGFTAVAIIYANFDDTAPLVTWTDTPSASGAIVLGGLAGTIAIRLPKATTELLTSTPLRWTLRLTAPDGTQTVLLAGAVRRLPIGPLA